MMYNIAVVVLYLTSYLVSIICFLKKLQITKKEIKKDDIAKKYNNYSTVTILTDAIIFIIFEFITEGGITPNPRKEILLFPFSWSVIIAFASLILLSVFGIIEWRCLKKYFEDSDFYKREFHIYGCIFDASEGWRKWILSLSLLGSLQMNLITRAVK